MDFLKNVKNLAIVAASSNFNWLIDNRHLIKHIDKIIVLTMPAIQKELKKQYRGSDVYFKYIDEMVEAAQICDCVMFVNVTKDIEREYMRLAKKHNMLKYVISPKGADYNNLIINSPLVNGNEYEMFDLNVFLECGVVIPPNTIVYPVEELVSPITKTITPVAEIAIESVKKTEESTIKEEQKIEVSHKEETKSKKPFGKGRK